MSCSDHNKRCGGRSCRILPFLETYSQPIIVRASWALSRRRLAGTSTACVCMPCEKQEQKKDKVSSYPGYLRTPAISTATVSRKNGDLSYTRIRGSPRSVCVIKSTSTHKVRSLKKKRRYTAQKLQVFWRVGR